MTIPSPSIVRQTLSPKIKGIISSYPSVIRVPIAWGEMDMFGHLNNIWHARYAETASKVGLNRDDSHQSNH
jgi:acyl-CoA thioesterase FadM